MGPTQLTQGERFGFNHGGPVPLGTSYGYAIENSLLESLSDPDFFNQSNYATAKPLFRIVSDAEQETKNTRALSWTFDDCKVGDIFTISISSEDSAASYRPGAPTATGVTFTSRQINTTSSFTYEALYTGVVTSVGTKTITCAAPSTAVMHGGVAYHFPAANGYSLATTPVAALVTGTTGVPTLSLAGCSVGSTIVATSGDWNAVNESGRAYNATSSPVTERASQYFSGAATEYYYDQQVATAGTQTVAMTAPAGQKWCIAAIEILRTPPGGGGTAWTGDAPLTTTAALTATGTVTKNGAAAQPVTATLDADGAVTTYVAPPPRLTRGSGGQVLRSGVAWRTGGVNAYQIVHNDYPSSRLMSHAEIDNLMDDAVAMNSKFMRAHTLGVNIGSSSNHLVTGVTGTTSPVITYNSAVWEVMDYAIYSAQQRGIYLMVPLTDELGYYHGGKRNWVNFRRPGTCSTDFNVKAANSSTERAAENYFYTDAQIQLDFRTYVSDWLNHVNQYSGLTYKNDPTIAVVETGNEMWTAAQDAPTWTPALATYIKSIAPNVLVADGSATDGQAIVSQHMASTDLDIHGTHPYSTFTSFNVEQMAASCETNNKIFIVGEYPWSKVTAPDIEAAAENRPNIFASLFWSLQNDADLHNNGAAYGTDDVSLYYPGKDGTQTAAVARLQAHATAMMPVPAAFSRPSYRNDDYRVPGSLSRSGRWAVALTSGSTAERVSGALQMVTGAGGGYGDKVTTALNINDSADKTFSFDVTPQDATEAYFRIWMRATSSEIGGGTLDNGGNGYFIELTNSGNWSFSKRVGGTATVLISSTNVAGFAAGTVTHVEAILSGTSYTLRLWTGGTRPSTPSGSVTDAAVSGGYYGLVLNNGNTASARRWDVDNFAIGDPATAYGAALAVTASQTASGFVTKSISATQAVTSTISASGFVAKSGAATQPVTTTLTAAGATGTGAGVQYNGFGSGTSIPGVGSLVDGGDNTAVVGAVGFKTTLDNQRCLGVRYWRPSGPVTDQIDVYLRVYDPATGYPALGAPIAYSLYNTYTANGVWSEFRFPTPIALTAGVFYSLSIWDPGGHYAAVSHAFGSGDVPAPSGAAGLVFFANTGDHRNGTYRYGVTSTIPNQDFGETWYGIDGIFDGASTTYAASLASTSTLTAAGSLGKSSTGSLAAAATLDAAGLVTKAGDATAVVTTTLTADATRGVSSAASISSAATLSASGSAGNTGAAPTTVSATLSASSTRAAASGAPLAATASLSGTGTLAGVLTASNNVTATLSADGFVAHVGDATVSTSTTLTSAGQRAAASSAALSSITTLTADGTFAKQSSGSVTNTATLAADGTVAKISTAALSSSAVVLSTAGSRGQTLAAATAPVVSLTADGLKTIGSNDGTLPSTTTLSANGSVARASGGSVSAATTLAATGQKTMPLAASIAVASTQTAAGVVGSALTATQAVTASLSATGDVAEYSSGDVVETATLTSAGTRATTATAALVAPAVTLSSAGVRSQGITGAVVSTATLAADSSVNKNLTANQPVSVTLTTDSQVAYVNGADVASGVTLTSAGTVTKIGSATLSAAATLSTAGTVSKTGAATLAETATLSASGQRIATGTAPEALATTLSATGFMSASSTAARTTTAALTADGFAAHVGDVPLSSSAILSGSGLRATSTGAPRAQTVTLIADGSLTKRGAASVTPTVTLAADGNLTKSTTADIAAAVTVLADGVRAATELADSVIVGTLDADGTREATDVGDNNPVITLDADGTRAASSDADTLIASTLDADGTVAKSSLSDITQTVTLDAEGQRDADSDADTANVSVDLDAAGSNSAVSPAPETIAVSVDAAGLRAASSNSPRPVTVSLTGDGAISNNFPGSTFVTLVSSTQTAAGVITSVLAASRATSASLTASGQVSKSEEADTPTVTTTLTATGSIEGDTGATSTVSVSITASGDLQKSGSAPATTAVTVTATGLVTQEDGSAELVSVTLTADGRIAGSLVGVSVTTAGLTADGLVTYQHTGDGTPVSYPQLLLNEPQSILQLIWPQPEVELIWPDARLELNDPNSTLAVDRLNSLLSIYGDLT